MSENGYQYLEPARVGSLYRQPYLKGTRIRVEIPYARTVPGYDPVEEPGESVEQVAADCRVPVEAILEAIDWCQKNWDVVIADHAREDRLFEAHGMNHPNYKYNPKAYYRPLTSEERDRIINDEPLPG